MALFGTVYATPELHSSLTADWLHLIGTPGIQGMVASGTMNGKWGARLLTDLWSAVTS